MDVGATGWRDVDASPMVAVAVAVVALSTSAILVRWSQAPSIIKAFYRVLFTTLLLLPLAVFKYRSEFLLLSRRDLAVAVVTGVALAAHFVVWFESLNWTSVAASVTLVQSQPLFVAFGAFLFLNERVTLGTVAGMIVAVFGIVAMSFGDAVLSADAVTRAAIGGTALYGNMLAVVGAVTAAGYVLAGRSLRQRISLVPYVTVVYGACTVALFVTALADGQEVALTAYPQREWVLFLAMAVGPGIIGHTVINWALRYVESSVVSVTLLGEPVGSTLLAIQFLDELPSTVTVVGGVVVLAGIYVTTRAQRRT